MSMEINSLDGIDDTISKLRFLCGTGSNHPVSSSVTNAEVMLLVQAIESYRFGHPVRITNLPNTAELIDGIDPVYGERRA